MSDRYASTLGHRSKGDEFVAGELVADLLTLALIAYCAAAGWLMEKMR